MCTSLRVKMDTVAAVIADATGCRINKLYARDD